MLRLWAPLLLCCLAGCQDVSIGRQLPAEGSLEVVFETAIPTPDASVSLRAITVGPSGEIIVMGQFTGTLDFGDGVPLTATSDRGDAFLLVFGEDGERVATQTLSASFLITLRAVQREAEIHIVGHWRGALSDGEPLASSFSGQSALLARFGLDGTRLGVSRLSSTSGNGNVQGKGADVAGTRTVRCGNYLETLDLGGVEVDAASASVDNGYVVVSEAGVTEWARTLSALGPPSARGAFTQDCAFTADGGVLVVGDYDGTIALDGREETAEGIDGVIVSYDAEGTERWRRGLRGPGDQGLVHLESRDGGAVFSGVALMDFDLETAPMPSGMFVGALDAAGALRWTWSFGQAGDEIVGGLDASGPTTVVSGHFRGAHDALGWTSAGGQDGYVARLDDSGEVEWSGTFGSPAFDTCRAHALGEDLAVVCVFRGGLESAGGEPLPESGSLWVARVRTP